MIFILLATGMTLLAAGLVALPLWRAKIGSQDVLSAERAKQSQLIELDRDLTAGWLSESDYASAKRDIESEWDTSSLRIRPDQARSRFLGQPILATLTAILMIGVAGVLYYFLGNWRAGVEGVEAATEPAVRQMVADLAHRLQTTDQNDEQGWVMLGHAYVIMEQYDDAVDAYSHARTLSADTDADALAGYGEALALAHPDEFMDKALPAFEKALQIAPSNPQALWYGGLGAFERGDKKLAVERWNALLAQDPPAEYRQVIEKYIVQAGGTVQSIHSSKAGEATAIAIQVKLAEPLQGRVRPDAYVYVFAQPLDGPAGGPPVAVKRMRADTLPASLTLSDEDSMMVGRKLSSYPDLVLTARVSLHGSPQAMPGDLFGTVNWHRGTAMSPVKIVIDRIEK